MKVDVVVVVVGWGQFLRLLVIGLIVMGLFDEGEPLGRGVLLFGGVGAAEGVVRRTTGAGELVAGCGGFIAGVVLGAKGEGGAFVVLPPPPPPPGPFVGQGVVLYSPSSE